MVFARAKKGAIIALISGAVVMSGVQGATAQVPGLGSLLGGTVGGVIGSRGGAGGAVVGAIIGIAAGAILQGLIDDIERNNAKNAANQALKSGRGGTKTFKNSQGQKVKVATKVRTYKEGNQSCREITTSVERDGQSSSGGGTQKACVQVASGKANYGTIQ